MTYTTENTIWPTSVEIPEAVKGLIDLFYALADKPEITGETFASEVFSSDGEIFSIHKTFKGTEEIKKFREGSWNLIISRRHEIRRVYVHDAAGTDYLLIGHITNGLKNGKTVAGEFISKIVIDAKSLDDGKPRISYMQVWADTAPLFAALKDD